MACAVDATRCPLCQQANQCAMEIEKTSGIAQAPCWCMQWTFDPVLLSRLPAQSRGVACICHNCAMLATTARQNVNPPTITSTQS